jgi:hypothetical protein
MRGFSPALSGLSAILLAALGLHGALAASGVVATSRAGDGQRVVSGFRITQVHPSLAPSDPTKVATVRFRLDRVTAQAFVQFPTVSATWTSCALTGGGRDATCTPSSPVPVAAVTRLRVASAV